MPTKRHERRPVEFLTRAESRLCWRHRISPVGLGGVTGQCFCSPFKPASGFPS
jgi:hypothetical protein